MKKRTWNIFGATILTAVGLGHFTNFAHLWLTGADEPLWWPLVLGVSHCFLGLSLWQQLRQVDASR